MSSVTNIQRNSTEGMVQTPSSNNHQKSNLDRKVTTVATTTLPCYEHLESCLSSYLNDKVSKVTIEDAANHLQGISIPRGMEHFTIQKKLITVKDLNFQDMNRLHGALIHCMKTFEGMPLHLKASSNHSDK